MDAMDVYLVAMNDAEFARSLATLPPLPPPYTHQTVSSRNELTPP